MRTCAKLVEMTVRVEGWCWFLGVVDHCVTYAVGRHVAKMGDRWAALEPMACQGN